MRKHFSIFIFLLIFTLVLPLQAQDFLVNSSVTGVCYAGNKTNRIFIPPPEKFYKKNGSKGGGEITIYYSGFPNQETINPIEHAASILEALLPADTKLTVLARWQRITTAGVLGNSSITGYAGGWAIDALNPFAYYPAALAEKIAGESLNSDITGDIELNINSTRNWYLGIDGNTPDLAYDLVTIALHEICHGLGFFDNMNVDNTIGWYGVNSIPLIYETFVENQTGERLTDTLKFSNYSSELFGEMSGGPLYFNGPLVKEYTSGSRARLYVPSVFDAGSSISHIDEATYIHSLMTPYIDMGEAIHNPGNLTLSMLGDLGWINTRIIHEPMKDTEEYLTEIALSAIIKSDTLYNRDNVGIVYSYDNFLNSDTIYMISLNSDDSFSNNINIPSYNTEVQYYFFVEDCFSRIYRLPSLFEFFRYKVFVGADTVKPEINHTPEDYYLETIDTIDIQATVTDNKGIDTVYIEYRIDDNQSQYLGLKRGTPGNFSVIINAKSEFGNNEVDSLNYRIFAVDSALVPNISVLPDSGYFNVKIEHLGSTIEDYATDFTNAESDFIYFGFNIAQPEGFSSNALHSIHPYISPEDNDKNINYTALLRFPLKFNESGMLISFKEIVLVEPGESGSLFGSDDFYDYVVVEGSKNFGKTWFSLADGYDSRTNSSWETSYNNSVIEMNSTFKGIESMLLYRTVFYRPSNNISAEDTLLVRFRLYSDPFANGWGWVVEDLKINPLVNAVELISNDPVIIYPNPGRGLIRFSQKSSNNELQKPIRYSIFNTLGICLMNGFTSEDAEPFIDISSFPTGIYIIILNHDDGIKTFKYSLIK